MIVKYYSAVFVIITFPCYRCKPIQYYDYSREEGLDNKALFWCQQLRACIPSKMKVCGWDSELTFLAEFENVCILYRANCKGSGHFKEIDMIVCETKKKYDKEHGNETFEWEHVLSTNVPLHDLNKDLTKKQQNSHQKTKNPSKSPSKHRKVGYEYAVKRNGQNAFEVFMDDEDKNPIQHGFETTTKRKNDLTFHINIPRLYISTTASFVDLKQIEIENMRDEAERPEVKAKPYDNYYIY